MGMTFEDLSDDDLCDMMCGGVEEPTVEEILEQNGFFYDDDIEMLQIDGMARALVWVSEDDRLVYSYEKMVQLTMEQDGCSRDDAMDFVSYDILRGLSYVTDERKPIVIYEVKGE